jgi:hypothetical protein
LVTNLQEISKRFEPAKEAAIKFLPSQTCASGANMIRIRAGHNHMSRNKTDADSKTIYCTDRSK